MNTLNNLIHNFVPFKSLKPSRYDIDEIIEERDSFETIAAEIGENQEALQREMEHNNHLEHRISRLQKHQLKKDEQHFESRNRLIWQINNQAYLIQKLSQANQALQAQNALLNNECLRLNQANNALNGRQGYFNGRPVIFY